MIRTATIPFRHRRVSLREAIPADPSWSVESVVISEDETFATVTLSGSIDVMTLDAQTLMRLGRCFALQFLNAPQQSPWVTAEGPLTLRMSISGVWGRMHGQWYLKKMPGGRLFRWGCVRRSVGDAA